MPLTFQHPFWLLILLLIPVLWMMMRRSPRFGHGTSRVQSWLIGGLRSLLILLLALALADPRLQTPSDRVNLFFCLDVSESISSEAAARVQTFLHTAIQGMDAEDHAGLIVFGKHPSLEIPLGPDFAPRPIRSEVNANFTNIAAALQFAIGKFPSQGQNRIVLLTDGQENLGEAADMASLANSLDIDISPVPLMSWFSRNEAFVKTLDSPSTAPLETPYEVKVVLRSSQAQQGELVLLRDGALVVNQPVNLRPGTTVMTFTDRLSEPGLYLYNAVLNVPGDQIFQNNEGLSFTRGTRRSQILYLADTPPDQTPLGRALRLQGLDLAHRTLAELSGSLHDLLEYNAVLLDNVSGQTMSFTTMEHLEKYVKDLGGGLIMIGGDQSFGAGYYKHTPVEKALPVFMDAPTDLTFSALCLIFVLDKSSSMTTRYANQSKLEMAKIATFSSIELLNPTDRVGIVAFDSQFTWIVPVTKASERQQIAQNLSRVKEGGGTHLYPALEDAYHVLQQVDAARKHIIVLSDGLTEEADFQSLVQAMQASQISVSTVAIGTGSDRDLMRAIAQWGQGRSYYTEDPNTIPKIFTGETKIVAKELITEQPLQPTQSLPHAIVHGISADFPPIYGQIVTYPKPGASVILTTGQGPLLAAWQYGLGRSVAFTADLAPRWGKDWVRWAEYGRFTAQLVKWAQRKPSPHTYMAQIERQGEAGRFTVDVTDPQQHFINHLDLQMNVVFPSERRQTFPVDQIAPGRYQGTFPAEEIGAYYLSLFAPTPNDSTPPEVFGIGIPYTDEFTRSEVDHALLGRLASLTEGEVFSLDDAPATLFTADAAPAEGTPLWPSCALALLGVLLLDVLVRKLVALREAS
ncbi:VWA domain-containing protein [candidate division KSB3 bacterium]|uniref:VWA domain-containing protein n=1 Tax=candidate division KSB3 bacterium TaxID=2044937 RepID=A0A9D5JX78_9BACT|nr:VWA domain-containing protein [candidate division KSB3 bacterium]MBD3325391.1 VWA domain-containing protein [candidate division KSB3 bacterium]